MPVNEKNARNQIGQYTVWSTATSNATLDHSGVRRARGVVRKRHLRPGVQDAVPRRGHERVDRAASSAANRATRPRSISLLSRRYSRRRRSARGRRTVVLIRRRLRRDGLLRDAVAERVQAPPPRTWPTTGTRRAAPAAAAHISFAKDIVATFFQERGTRRGDGLPATAPAAATAASSATAAPAAGAAAAAGGARDKRCN